MDDRSNFAYCAYFCEENVWKLCQESLFSDREIRVVFVSNPSKPVALWHQKAAPSPEMPVIWDYHVFLLVKDEEWQVWDLDTTLGFPLSASEYWKATFAMGYALPVEFQPWFRVLTGEEYQLHFSSDRSHMLDPQGKWMKEPPSWTSPWQEDKGMNLNRFVEMKEGFVGEICELGEMWRRFA